MRGDPATRRKCVTAHETASTGPHVSGETCVKCGATGGWIRGTYVCEFCWTAQQLADVYGHAAFVCEGCREGDHCGRDDTWCDCQHRGAI